MADPEIHIWPSEPDDGHDHVFEIDVETETDVADAVMCSRCGLLSIDESPSE